jgi:hypothetical protein
VIKLDVDKLENTSQQYSDTVSKSRVTRALCMDFDDVDEEITVHKTETPGNPYMHCSDVSSIIQLSLISRKFFFLYISSLLYCISKSNQSEKTEKLRIEKVVIANSILYYYFMNIIL